MYVIRLFEIGVTKKVFLKCQNKHNCTADYQKIATCA